MSTKKVFAVWSYLNQIGFAVRVNESDYSKAKELAYTGFSRWNDVDNFPEYHDVGFAEPTMELLELAGIQYEILSIPEYEDYFPDWVEDIVSI